MCRLLGPRRAAAPGAGAASPVAETGRASVRRSARLLAPLLGLIMLSACESTGSQGDFDAAGGSAGSGKPLAGMELGKGPTKVTMLLPLSADGAAGEKGRRMRDAAELAVGDLGSELITLTIEDTAGSAERARRLAMQAISSGSRVVIGPTEPQAVRHLASLAGKRPPVLALAEGHAGAPGVYSMLLTEADSAAAGAGALAAKGKRKFVLLVADGPDARTTERRVENALSIHGAKLAATLPYQPSGLEKALGDMQALVEDPEVIVLASGDTDPGPMAAALRTKAYLEKDDALVVTSRGVVRGVAAAELQGAYVATLGPPETEPYADRFVEKFSYTPDLTVAYAYDTVALSSGIVSALGPEGVRRETLENKSGFTGSTGFFRFRADGSSERRMPLYRIENGGLKEVEAAVSSF